MCRDVYPLLTNPPEVPRTDGLRSLRSTRGLSLTTAAGHFGVWPAKISALERGLHRDDDLANLY